MVLFQVVEHNQESENIHSCVQDALDELIEKGYDVSTMEVSKFGIYSCPQQNVGIAVIMT